MNCEKIVDVGAGYLPHYVPCAEGRGIIIARQNNHYYGNTSKAGYCMLGAVDYQTSTYESSRIVAERACVVEAIIDLDYDLVAVPEFY